MSYPQGVATGNAVIVAALEWDASRTVALESIGRSYERQRLVAEHLRLAERNLQAAVRAHRAAIAVEHVQGPDIDADLGQSADEPADIIRDIGGVSDPFELFHCPTVCDIDFCVGDAPYGIVCHEDHWPRLTRQHDVIECVQHQRATHPYFCAAHYVIEPRTQETLRTGLACGECWHFFESPEVLVAAHNAVLREISEEDGHIFTPISDVEGVHCCPVCIHDF